MNTTSFTLADGSTVLSQTPDASVDRVLVLMHGRGASAANILTLTNQLTLTNTTLVLALEAPDHSWYPKRFIETQSENQPYLDQSLQKLTNLLQYVQAEYELPTDKVVLAGFSQGACLIAEFIKRNPKQYAGVAILSGGLIGSEEEALQTISGSLANTPIYLSCDQTDPHIPKERVQQSADYFKTHAGNVTVELFQGLGHTIHPNGVTFIDAIIQKIST